MLERLPAKIKCWALVSKFHMNAFPFSGHYDGNRPYHNICFALELSPVIYAPRVQIFYVTIQATVLSGRARGGLQGLNLRDLYICEPVRLGGETLVAVPVCDCGPPVRERRLERLPSRVAFVW